MLGDLFAGAQGALLGVVIDLVADNPQGDILVWNRLGKNTELHL